MKILKLVFPLTVISAVCAAVLAYVNSLTEGPIKNIASLKANAAALAVMPAGTKAIDTRDDASEPGSKLFIGYSDEAKKTVVGYAVPGLSKNGYGGAIRLMVGLTVKREVVTYKTLAANETPGLGSKLNEPAFVKQFAGKPGAALKVNKDGGDIDAITGATITSRAVCDAIANACSRIDQLEGKAPAAAAEPAPNEGTIVLDVTKPENQLKVLPKGTVKTRPLTSDRFPAFVGIDANGKTTGYAVVGTGRGRGPDGEIVVHMLYGLTANGEISRTVRALPVNKLDIASVDMVAAQGAAINAAMKDAVDKFGKIGKR